MRHFLFFALTKGLPEAASLYREHFTSVDKLFDASPVVDEVCALLDWVLTIAPCLPWHLDIDQSEASITNVDQSEAIITWVSCSMASAPEWPMPPLHGVPLISLKSLSSLSLSQSLSSSLLPVAPAHEAPEAGGGPRHHQQQHSQPANHDAGHPATENTD